MILRPTNAAELAGMPLECPDCGWQGPGASALGGFDDVVRCPNCGDPVERARPLAPQREE